MIFCLCTGILEVAAVAALLSALGLKIKSKEKKKCQDSHSPLESTSQDF